MPRDQPSAESGDPADELFDVVDLEDRVIGQERRSVVHARGLAHRAVHIFVFNSRGQLLVQRRSALKDEFPLTYTSSASGHVGAAETYEECAPRELKEEIGLEAPLEWIVKLPPSPETANEQTVLFRTVSDAIPTPNENEVASLTYFTLDELSALLSADPGAFSPPFATLLRWYLAKGHGKAAPQESA
ncbi:MAG TPA: NUDIX domain-containing protein [Planctomycetaceae bacterium]|jgi:16S rRNA (adenine1518-N6/adenine1519-N6)-dimethyltransferase|nr:NUDIX domain-containing protein [Planctomycetaceae bacterium]